MPNGLHRVRKLRMKDKHTKKPQHFHMIASTRVGKLLACELDIARHGHLLLFGYALSYTGKQGCQKTITSN